ncbi:HEPN domain-containing protein [Alcanivorax sp.]|uniref:HEPN domain-containing protein n=1 Tax=Alcanivorax sp. TaxID=1872427 RepID=UPI0025BD29ED|nr:HEPN domain-containing protein [Alcanivorax sp.]
MPTSMRFKEMRARLNELRHHMLPAKFSPTGDYSDRQLDRTRGYRVLVHAEIESYLEDVAREAVTQAIQKWKSNKKPSTILLAFLAAYHSGWNSNDDRENEEIVRLAKARSRVKDSINEAIDIAQKQYITNVRDNHGVKEKNFKRLIIPLGIEIDELDGTWLTNLDNFGASRGETAHKTKRATGQINPEDEYKTVQSLVKGLKELDEKILQAKK